MFEIKHASTDFDTCQEIMRQVYEERPEHWPYGLSAAHFDGGLWMIRKQASGEPAGFVGWQERREHGVKVGYYSVGLLPPYRGKGMAKTAVNQLLAHKAAGVDKVRALIGDHNEASQRLAQALQPLHPVEVDLFKQAVDLSGVGHLLGHYALPAYGNAVFWDQAMHPEQKLTDSMQFKGFDKGRGMMAALNAALGAIGGHSIIQGSKTISKGMAPLEAGANAEERAAASAEKLKNIVGGSTMAAGGLGSIVLSPTKDLIMRTLPVMNESESALKDLQNRANRPPSPLTNIDPKWLAGGAAAGLAGLGGLAYAGVRGAKAMNAIADKQRKGTVRVTLPSKGPTEAETQVEMPIEDVRLSDSIYHALGRDTRRRLRGESTERKRHFLTEQQRAHNLGINMNDDGIIVGQD